MRFVLIGVMLSSLVARSAMPQNCPAADSVFGSKAKKGDLGTKYDTMTDTVTVSTKTDGRSRAEMRILAASQGQALKPGSPTVFEYTERQVANDTRQSLTTANAKYSDSSPLLMLADGQDRIPLAGGRHTVAISPAFGPLPASLTETLRYPVTTDQLVLIGRAKEVKLRMGGYETKLAEKVRDGARALYRALICPSPQP